MKETGQREKHVLEWEKVLTDYILFGLYIIMCLMTFKFRGQLQKIFYIVVQSHHSLEIYNFNCVVNIHPCS